MATRTRAGAWRVVQPLELSPILEAALAAFHEHGFHGTSVRDIARRVGRTVPALYYHHDNKEGLLVALLHTTTEDILGRVRAAAEEAGDRVDLAFTNVVEAIVLFMTHHRRLAALDAELRYLSPANRRSYAATRKEIEQLLGELVSRGVRDGVFTPARPDEVARALLGMCQSIPRWYDPAGALSPAQVTARYVDIALMTVGVRDRPRRRQSSTVDKRRDVR